MSLFEIGLLPDVHKIYYLTNDTTSSFSADPGAEASWPGADAGREFWGPGELNILSDGVSVLELQDQRVHIIISRHTPHTLVFWTDSDRGRSAQPKNITNNPNHANHTIYV